MAKPVIKTIAVGSLAAFGSALMDHVFTLPKDPWHEAPDGFALQATSTASETVVIIQDNISGDMIEFPPKPRLTAESS